MSFVIHYAEGKLKKAEMLYMKETPCPSHLCEDKKTFCVGEVFGCTYEDIASTNWRDDQSVLNTIDGDIAIAYADSDFCIFATDLCGIDNLYYYYQGSELILSDDIWDIICILEPEFDDINAEWVRKSIFSLLIDGETVVKNLKVLLPSHIARYDAESGILSIDRYQEFHYANKIKNIDDAVESMDRALDKMFECLKKKWGDQTFGMGLSGGLDSRIIPHYAKKYNLRLTSFNICNKRPKGILLASSCKNAMKLAKVFQIPFKLIEWKPDKLDEKIYSKIKMQPLAMLGKNTFKFEQEGIPCFDIMLSGGFGELIGNALPTDIIQLDREGVIEAIKGMFAKVFTTTTFKSRCNRAFNYMFHINLHLRDKNELESVQKLIQKDYEEVISWITDYVNTTYGAFSNIEIFENYLLNAISTRNRCGAFESQFGTKRSIATYVPFVFKEIINWDPELLLNRKVLPALIKKKVPEAADIGTDSYTASPSKNRNVLNRIISVGNRVIRGNGTAIDENNFNKKAVRDTFNKTMNNDKTWFYTIIDTRPYHSQIFDKKQMQLAITIWEMKYLIDYIEDKRYLEMRK